MDDCQLSRCVIESSRLERSTIRSLPWLKGMSQNLHCVTPTLCIFIFFFRNTVTTDEIELHRLIELLHKELEWVITEMLKSVQMCTSKTLHIMLSQIHSFQSGSLNVAHLAFNKKDFRSEGKTLTSPEVGWDDK